MNKFIHQPPDAPPLPSLDSEYRVFTLGQLRIGQTLEQYGEMISDAAASAKTYDEKRVASEVLARFNRYGAAMLVTRRELWYLQALSVRRETPEAIPCPAVAPNCADGGNVVP